MNKMIRTLLTVAALATGSVAFAQPAVKLVTVDVAKVYDGFYKAQDGMAKIQDARQKAQDQAEEYRKQGQLLVDEYKDLVEQSKNTLLTPDAKAKAEQNAQKKLEEIQRKQADLQNFMQSTDRSLQQQMMTRSELLLEEISKAVKDVAKRKGATIVIDKSGPSGYGIPVVIDSDPAYEITADVITEVNKDKPAAAPATATTPAAATPAPATAAPAFTVPNVSAPKSEPTKK